MNQRMEYCFDQQWHTVEQMETRLISVNKYKM